MSKKFSRPPPKKYVQNSLFDQFTMMELTDLEKLKKREEEEKEKKARFFEFINRFTK